MEQDSLNEFNNILIENGYKINHSLRKNRKHRNTNTEVYSTFKVPFINDNCNRKINKLIKKYNLPIKLVNEFGRQSVSVFNNKKYSNLCKCYICTQVPKYNCKVKYVVYRYTCRICKEFYIGKTVREFHCRHNEHRRAIINKSTSSALYQHIRDKHANVGDIEGFWIDFIAKHTNTRDTTISEAKSITDLKPTTIEDMNYLTTISLHISITSHDIQHIS